MSQLPQWPVYCNNEVGVNNSLICGHLGPGTHGVTICRRQVRRTGDGGQVLREQTGTDKKSEKTV